MIELPDRIIAVEQDYADEWEEYDGTPELQIDFFAHYPEPARPEEMISASTLDEPLATGRYEKVEETRLTAPGDKYEQYCAYYYRLNAGAAA